MLPIPNMFGYAAAAEALIKEATAKQRGEYRKRERIALQEAAERKNPAFGVEPVAPSEPASETGMDQTRLNAGEGEENHFPAPQAKPRQPLVRPKEEATGGYEQPGEPEKNVGRNLNITA